MVPPLKFLGSILILSLRSSNPLSLITVADSGVCISVSAPVTRQSVRNRVAYKGVDDRSLAQGEAGARSQVPKKCGFSTTLKTSRHSCFPQAGEEDDLIKGAFNSFAGGHYSRAKDP